MIDKWHNLVMTRVTQFLNPNSFTLHSSLALCRQHSSLTLSAITLTTLISLSYVTLLSYFLSLSSHSISFTLFTLNSSQPHHIHFRSCFYILISHFLGFFRSFFGFAFTVYSLCFFYHLWSCFRFVFMVFLGFFRSFFGFSFTVYSLCFFYHLRSCFHFVFMVFLGFFRSVFCFAFTVYSLYFFYHLRPCFRFAFMVSLCFFRSFFGFPSFSTTSS